MRKAINHLKKSDPILSAIIERVGACRMEFGPPEFHSLAEAIVYQQLNGKAAVTIFKRFAALAGDPVTPEGILKLTRCAVALGGIVQAEVFLSQGYGPARRPRRARLLTTARDER